MIDSVIQFIWWVVIKMFFFFLVLQNVCFLGLREIMNLVLISFHKFLNLLVTCWVSFYQAVETWTKYPNWEKGNRSQAVAFSMP